MELLSFRQMPKLLSTQSQNENNPLK